MSKIGNEYEFLLLDKEGYVANQADRILNDPRNLRLAEPIVPEISLAQVEINSKPVETIAELHHDLLPRLALLEDICQDHGLLATPISELGAGRGERRNGKARYELYTDILSARGNDLLHRITGIHAHLDQEPDRILDQLRLIVALDPLSAAVTANSPITPGYLATPESPLREGGFNSANNWRIVNMRTFMFAEYPLHAQLLGYPSSLQEIGQQNQQRWEEWLDVARKKGKEDEYRAGFQPDNTGFLPYRLRPFGPKGTIEIRAFGSVPLDIDLATLAFLKGSNDRMIERNIPVRISEVDGEYSFTDKEIVLPPFRTVQRFAKLQANYGLEKKPSPQLAEYLSQVLTFAEEGLPQEDRPYQQPLWEMAATGKNHSSLILEYLHQQRKERQFEGPIYAEGRIPQITASNIHRFSEPEVAQAQLFARKLYVDSLSLPIGGRQPYEPLQLAS